MVSELARSRSKLITAEFELVIVIGDGKFTVTVGEDSVAVSFVGTPAITATTSGFNTLNDALVKVPGGSLATVRGSKVPASCTNSTSVGFESTLGLMELPPLSLPERVSVVTFNSKART